MQAGAGTANLSGHQRQRDQAAGVIRPVHVLGYAHAPENNRGFCRGIKARHLLYLLSGDTADGRHLFRTVLLHCLHECGEALGMGIYERAVVQALVDNRVHHAVQQQHVGAGPQLQECVGMQVHLGTVRFDHDQLAAVFGCIFHERGRHRMVVVGTGAYHDNDFSLCTVCHLVGDRARADGFQQCGNRGGMAQAGTVIDVIGDEGGPHQFLEQVGFFVTAFGAAETGQGL